MALKIYQRERCRLMVCFKTYETKLSLEEIRFREDLTRARIWKVSDNSASKWKSRVEQEEVIPSEERACTDGPDLVGRNKQCLNLTGGFPDSSVGKESTCNAGDPGSTPGPGRSAGEGIGYPLQYSWASPVAQLAKNLPAMQIWIRSLDWEDPLEKGKATHSSIQAWRIPWTVQPMGSQTGGHDWATFTLGFPNSSVGKESACNAGDLGSIPGLGRSP